MDLSLDNVITVSVAEIGQGIGRYNTSNIGLFTREVPLGSFGSLGYKIYLEPSAVGKDWGTSSLTYKMALSIFSQQPNILANGGYLVVFEMLGAIVGVKAVQALTFPATPTSGDFKLNFDGDITAAIPYNVDAATLQTEIRTLTGMAAALVTGSVAAGFSIDTGIEAPTALMTVSDDTLQDAGLDPVIPAIATTTAGVAPEASESLATAIDRTLGLVQYFGVLITEIVSEVDMLAAANVIQSVNKMIAFASRTPADVLPNGRLDKLRQGFLWKSRGMFYGSDNDTDALLFTARYFGRALSVVFTGSNTTLTMNMKTLTGQLPDPTIDQTILNQCKTAGVDTYASYQGVGKVGSQGANKFFDQAYNLLAFVGDIQVAGFNLYAQTATKVPQTEQGMDLLKSEYRTVCRTYVTNQFIAPGRWTLPDTFGNQADFYDNIEQYGYFLYSAPVSQQLQADRADRIAPLVQIAIKEAGAQHKSSVIINVNA
jgi:hypothetical protein